MTTKLLSITVPPEINFADLKLVRHTDNGDISFDWGAIERLCEHNGMDPNIYLETHEGNVLELIIAWYAAHIAAGGDPDPVMVQIMAEALAEDKRGGGLSYPPGRA